MQVSIQASSAIKALGLHAEYLKALGDIAQTAIDECGCADESGGCVVLSHA